MRWNAAGPLGECIQRARSNILFYRVAGIYGLGDREKYA